MALSDSVTPSKEKTHVEKKAKAMLPLSYLLVYYSHLQNCATPRLKMANMLSLLIQENLHSFQSEFSLSEERSTDVRREANKGCYLLDTARLWGKLGHASNETNFVLM